MALPLRSPSDPNYGKGYWQDSIINTAVNIDQEEEQPTPVTTTSSIARVFLLMGA